MEIAKLHPNEPKRLAALLQYEVLDTDDERSFDELTELASAICSTPISLISLVDDTRQWFKSKVGLDASQTDRSLAFCAHAILQDKVFEVPNALQDTRFSDNPLVTDAPDIRFYAGAPLVAPDGSPIGTLCVIDTEPKALDDSQKRALQILSNQVISQLELRLHNRKLERMNANRSRLYAMLAHDLKSPFNGIIGLSKLLNAKAQNLSADKVYELSQGILSSSVELFQLLDETLQWSEQSLITTKLEPKNLALKKLVADCVALLKDAAALKNIAVDNEIPESIEVFSDPMITKTVVRNIVANAFKYSPEGGRVLITCDSDHEETVHVRISDEGEGIDEALASSLFSENVLSAEGTIGEQGHGLGLMLCAHFLQMQGNKIWLDASYTDGAKFVFELPSSSAQK